MLFNLAFRRFYAVFYDLSSIGNFYSFSVDKIVLTLFGTFMHLIHVYVVVNFLFQLIFIFPLFWGMVMYANEFKTKEKQKLTEIKN